MSSSTDIPEDQSAGRRDNGLEAASFVPIVEVEAAMGSALLTALRRAKIAAYVVPTTDPARELLYAASADRVDARTIVISVWRASQRAAAEPSAGATQTPTTQATTTQAITTEQAISAPDPLAGRDPNAEFQAIVADWHVDTVAAIRSAERDLTREDSDWRAHIALPPASEDTEEHFVPPPPPPLPRLSVTTVAAILLIALSITILALGSRLGLSADMTFLTGIGGILLGTGVFVMKLRAQPSDDDDGDGAVL